VKKNENNHTNKLTDTGVGSGKGLFPRYFLGILYERMHFDALFTEEY